MYGSLPRRPLAALLLVGGVLILVLLAITAHNGPREQLGLLAVTAALPLTMLLLGAGLLSRRRWVGRLGIVCAFVVMGVGVVAAVVG